MESQPDIVAAAEALRTWVVGQRAAWAATDAALFAPPAAPKIAVPKPAAPAVPHVPAAPVPSPAAPAPPPVFVPTPPVPAAAGFPVVPEPMEAVPVAAASVPAAVLDGTGEWPETAAPGSGATVIIAELSLMERTWVRAALAALLLLAVGGGYLVMSRRAANAVGAAAFASTPEGAEVFVDGAPVGRTPVRAELKAGTHTVEFKLNAATRTQTIAVKRGVETPVIVDWNKKAFGSLVVASTPTGAKVSIDGKLRGQTPLTLSDLPVGSHAVLIDSTEGAVRRKVEITDGGTESLNESIYPGWLHVSTSIDVTILDGGKPALLDDSNRVLLKPGPHTVRIENRELAFSQTKQVEIEPGGTTKIAIEVPTSTLTVTGSTGADVFVDGVKAGETPLVEFKVALGSHDIMVVDRSGVTRHASTRVTTRPVQLDISFDRP